MDERVYILCKRQKRMLAKSSVLGIDIPILKGKKQYLWCRHCKIEHALDLYDFCKSQDPVYFVGSDIEPLRRLSGENL